MIYPKIRYNVGDMFRWQTDSDILVVESIENDIICGKWLSRPHDKYPYSIEEIEKSIYAKKLTQISKLEIAIMELQSSEDDETSNLK